MKIGQVGHYMVTYADGLEDDWKNSLPQSKWMLFTIVREADQEQFCKVTAECLKHQPSGICCAGPAAYLLENWFDDEIVTVALAWEEKHQKAYDYEFAPVTTADADLDEGFWYAVTLAPNMAAEPIETIFCLDLTGTQQPRISQLISLINDGWLPPDSKND